MKHSTFKKATEKLKIRVEYKFLGNVVKMKTKQGKETLPGFIRKIIIK